MSDTFGRVWSPARLVGVVARPQTYKNLAYLLVTLPLAIVYASVLTVGFAFGLILSIVLVGLAVLLGIVIAARGLAGIERWLANALLSVELRTPDDVSAGDGPIESARRYLEAPSTWRGLGFLSVKFYVGIVGIILVVFLAETVQLLFAPLQYPARIEFGEVNDEPVAWTIQSLPESLLAAVVGLVGAIVVLHLINGFAYVVCRIAEALLGGDSDA
ncbi:histidine kinase [Halobacteriales archaeon QH_10_67_13]|nr:MAG: histidine kinase [Halobacteriales archaeon QH_10_67_13]